MLMLYYSESPLWHWELSFQEAVLRANGRFYSELKKLLPYIFYPISMPAQLIFVDIG